jgi:AcrR family transcriptional regulator
VNSPIESRPGARDLKAEIIDEATRLFAEKGYAATAIREVAAACGCTKPALYYHFASKEALFRSIVESEFARMAEFMTAPEGVTLRERMHGALAVFSAYAEAHPNSLRLLHRVETRPETQMPAFDMAAVRALHLQIVTSLIAEGQAGGEVRADVDRTDCALALTGAINYQFMLWHAGEGWDPERLQRTVDLFFEGIGS